MKKAQKIKENINNYLFDHIGLKLFLDYFKSFKLDPFSVDWNNEIGFAPEYLYEKGQTA